MLRRDFLSSFMAAIAGAPQAARSGDAPDRMRPGPVESHGRSDVALCEQLSLRVEQLSREVETLTQELADADRHRSRFLSLVHDMRAPLACIHLRTELMVSVSGGISDELQRHLDMSARSCASLAELINDAIAVVRTRARAA